MVDLPERGVGVSYVPGLEPLLEAGDGLIDVVEVDASTERCLDVAGPLPVVVRGVGAPLGRELAPIADDLDVAWVSGHLAADRVQTVERARTAAAAIVGLRTALGRPCAFETGANHHPRSVGMPDGSWFRAVTERADCGIVLDLHHLWHRADVEELLDDLPLDRVWEVRIAGGTRVRGPVHDHHRLVDQQLLDLAAAVVPLLPSLRAVILSVTPDDLADHRPTDTEIRTAIGALHRVWDLRRPSVAQVSDGPPTVEAPMPPMTAVPLTLRLLQFSRGRAALDEAVERCWSADADTDAGSLAAVLGERFADVPHLTEVLAYELALLEPGREGTPSTGGFTCVPGPLLEALRAGRRPPHLVARALHPSNHPQPRQLKAAADADAGPPSRTASPTAAPSAAAGSRLGS